MSTEGKDPRDEGSREETESTSAAEETVEETAEKMPDDDAEESAESDGDAASEDEIDESDGEQTVARDSAPTAVVEKTGGEAEKTASHAYYDDPYDEYNYEHDDPYRADGSDAAVDKAEPKPESAGTPPPPQEPTTDLEDDDEEGMARMSFLEHLEELRTRIIRSVQGLALAYIACLTFSGQLFNIFKAPFEGSAASLPYDPPITLTQTTPTEQFYIMYWKLPILAAIFLAAPWLMYQAWSFIAPGLYKRERKWAGPFIFSTAALFILGGVFCYFIAIRFALGFLVGLGFDANVRPMITVTSYYDMFFNLHVGLGAVFQMPVVIFFFTLLRITSPAFLIRHGRYAILIIFIIAALITPTPDVMTMLTFAAPMILLYYAGIGASYLIVLKREGRGLPWKGIIITLLILAAIVAGILYGMHYFWGYGFVPEFPWFGLPK